MENEKQVQETSPIVEPKKRSKVFIIFLGIVLVAALIVLFILRESPSPTSTILEDVQNVEVEDIDSDIDAIEKDLEGL